MRASSKSQHDSTTGPTGQSNPGGLSIPALRFRWIIVSGFLMAVGLITVVVGMAYRETKQQVKSSEWALHSRDVLSAISDYGTIIKGASNSASEYYKNGNESDAQAFEASAASTLAAVSRLRQMTADNPTQQHLVADLSVTTNQVLAVLRQVIDLHRQGISGPKGLEELTKNSRGVSTALNTAWTAMSTEENDLLKERSSQQAAASRKALRLELWGGLLAGLLMLAALALFLRESGARLQAQKQLAQANVVLEQRVRERIAEVQRVNQLLRKENAERIKAEDEIRVLNSGLEQRVADRTSQLETANKELEAFSYSVSHDLRAPLRHIDGFSKILREDFSAGMDPEALHCLNRIQRAISSMGHLVDDLLNLSRVSRKDLAPQRVALGDLVEAARAELDPDLAGRNITWRIGALPSVQGDANLLKQVFVNLLSNAIKFTRQCESAVIEVGQQAAIGETIIFVRDNGVGFNMKYADKLFGVFQRLHTPDQFEGTGVGLAIVQRIIQKHGGRVWAAAEPDHGACFYLTFGALPASLPEPHPDMERIVS